MGRDWWARAVSRGSASHRAGNSRLPIHGCHGLDYVEVARPRSSGTMLVASDSTALDSSCLGSYNVIALLSDIHQGGWDG